MAPRKYSWLISSRHPPISDQLSPGNQSEPSGPICARGSLSRGTRADRRTVKIERTNAPDPRRSRLG